MVQTQKLIIIMTTISTFKITAVGDLHFGNPKLKSEELYIKLVKYLYPELANTQLLLLTGDTYDQLTTVNSSANRYVLKFIQDIYSISSKTGMVIRVLHGTYSHDRDQVAIFDNLALPNTNAKVICKIDCEKLECFNRELKITYIPDNLPYKHSNEVMNYLDNVYKCLGWDKADIVLGHGSFDYALGCSNEHLPECTYTIEQIKPYVKDDGLVIMGHIHRPSHRANVYYCGSFDRMVHGEEEPKGFYTFIYQNKWVSKFCINPDAYKFITITPEGEDLDAKVHDLLNKLEKAFPEQRGYVRVLYTNSDDRVIYQRICAQTYPEVIFTGKRIGEPADSTLDLAELDIDTFTDVKPNINNLGDLVYNFLKERNKDDGIPKEVITNKVQQLLLD